MLDFADVWTPAGLAVLGQVILIDLTLAGDNVVVLGMLASGLPPKERRRVLGFGVAMALVFLILFAIVATQLLQVVGLLLAGGLLLLWVGWRLFRELHPSHPVPVDNPDTAEVEGPPRTKSFAKAAVQVAIANLSMSLDNVLAVAGAAVKHPTVLLFGLVLSVTLMAVAANFVARIIARHRWIAYVGLVVILWVAGKMIYDGLEDPHHGVLHWLWG